jgi:hypothetical protein
MKTLGCWFKKAFAQVGNSHIVLCDLATCGRNERNFYFKVDNKDNLLKIWVCDSHYKRFNKDKTNQNVDNLKYPERVYLNDKSTWLTEAKWRFMYQKFNIYIIL